MACTVLYVYETDYFFFVSGADFPVRFQVYVFVDFFPVFFLAILLLPPGFLYRT